MFLKEVSRWSFFTTFCTIVMLTVTLLQISTFWHKDDHFTSLACFLHYLQGYSLFACLFVCLPSGMLVYFIVCLFVIYITLKHCIKSISSFPGNVAVTSLLPMKQASLLVAGYSFGSFQIWDMQTLQPM